jgi:hypothetical protein
MKTLPVATNIELSKVLRFGQLLERVAAASPEVAVDLTDSSALTPHGVPIHKQGGA